MSAHVEPCWNRLGKPSDTCARRDGGRSILPAALKAYLRISVSSDGAITTQRMEEGHYVGSTMG